MSEPTKRELLLPEDAAEWKRLCAMVERGGNDGADIYEAEEWCKRIEAKYGSPFNTLVEQAVTISPATK